MTARPVRSTHTVAGRLVLTPDAQRLLVAEAMAQVRPEGEKAVTGVLGGIEAYISPSQKAWYEQELERALLAAQAPAAPASPEALAALSLFERRALAAQYGVLTPAGRPSSSVALIWAALQSALAAAGEMQAAPGGDASDSETQGAETHSDTPTQGEGVPVYPALVLDNPVTGPAYLPYHVGPFEQPEQRHYAGAVAEAVPADALPTAEEVIAELVTCVEAQAAVDLALDAGAVQGDIVRQEEIATRSLNWLMDLPGAHLRQLGAQAARDAALLAAYEEALTPSASTKYAYSGEFKIEVEELDEEGCPTVVRHDVDWTTLKDVLAAVRARVQAGVDGPHEQPEQQQAQRAGELFPHRSVAMLVESRFTRQDKALIPPEQRPELDDQMFERITQFDQQYRLNVEGQALFEHPDGPHAQPEQQQAQALAVAVAGFEPECRQCAALLDAKGQCPICPRPTPWEPCETGVRHHQTIPESREVAYAEHRKADRAATQARAAAAGPGRQRRLDEASQDAWTAFKRWKDADSFAARAGAFDHLHWADL